jgi:hypothetical protein
VRVRRAGKRAATWSNVTDETGSAVISVVENVEHVAVQHSDYATALAPAPEDLRTTVEVTLRRKASLRLDFKILPSGSRTGLCATLQPAEPWRAATGARMSALRSGLGNVDGVNVVPAGVPLCLRLTDCLGRLVHEEFLAPLAPDETAEQTVKLDWQPATLSLRVLDTTGHPVNHAAVLLGGRYQRWTEHAGRLELRALAPGPVTATIAHAAYVERTLSNIMLGPQSEPFDVYLVHR